MELINKPELINSIDSMADAMRLSRLPENIRDDLIEYVLFGGSDGKQTYASLRQGLITKREFRNLFMAHCQTTIQSYNNSNGSAYNMDIPKKLCQSFELSLLGEIVKPTAVDRLDSWESNEA